MKYACDCDMFYFYNIYIFFQRKKIALFTLNKHGLPSRSIHKVHQKSPTFYHKSFVSFSYPQRDPLVQFACCLTSLHTYLPLGYLQIESPPLKLEGGKEPILRVYQPQCSPLCKYVGK